MTKEHVLSLIKLVRETDITVDSHSQEIQDGLKVYDTN